MIRIRGGGAARNGPSLEVIEPASHDRYEQRGREHSRAAHQGNAQRAGLRQILGHETQHGGPEETDPYRKYECRSESRITAGPAQQDQADGCEDGRKDQHAVRVEPVYHRPANDRPTAMITLMKASTGKPEAPTPVSSAVIH